MTEWLAPVTIPKDGTFVILLTHDKEGPNTVYLCGYQVSPEWGPGWVDPNGDPCFWENEYPASIIAGWIHVPRSPWLEEASDD